MSGGVWITSYVLLWAAVLVLAFAVVVLLRQVGVLHARLRPTGVGFAGEGPTVDTPAPDLDEAGWDARVTLVAFTSPTCTICAALLPSLRALVRDHPDVGLRVVDHHDDTRATFRAWNVSSTPYVVAVDRHGIVRGGGVANSLEQVEVLVAVAQGASDVA